MTFRNLGLRSDLVAAGGATHVELRDGYALLRTPEEPDYWSGNALVVLSEGPEPAEAVALFEEHFPEARHCALVWDDPATKVDPTQAALGEAFVVRSADVMVFDGAATEADVPKGVSIRQIEEDGWDAVLALQLAIAEEEGFDLEPHEAFLRRRNRARRALVAAGRAAWFGAFEHDRLAGQLGMVTGEGIARFQAVETAAEHRRRGIASALLDHARGWALARDPAAQVVILADTDGAASRLYAARGFRRRESLVDAIRASYDTGLSAVVT